MSAKFAHLHLHTEYSLLDGLTKIKKLTAHVKELGMDSVALTDHGAMYGAIEFYKQCKKDEVKPIIGMEAYTTTLDHTIRDERAKKQRYHLLLLAKNEEGYKNLMKIASIAQLEGYYYKPRISNDVLAKYSKGIICTSACPAGELASHLIADDFEEARKTAKWFYDVFGEDYYLEVQRHNADKHINPQMPQEIQTNVRELALYEKKINEGVIKLSREMGIPIVATNDAHYLKKEDATAQDVLVCVATGVNVSDTKRIRFIDTPEFYVKSPDEMAALFPDLPDALENTVKVTQKCDLEISTLGKWFFPKYKSPKGKSPDEYLRELSLKKMKEKIPDWDDVTLERLNHELDIICTKGFAPYFLIVMDMVTWANEQGIITNTRGSAAGSLVSFTLGITTVNPLTYYLPFERFLNPYRPSPPDIDFDVSDNRREEILGYIADTYGHEKTAQICTFGRMLARAAARDVARVLGYPYAIGDRISKLIPPPKQGFPVNVPKALETNPELKELYDRDPDTKKILDLAHELEGSARHISRHAAAVVVAPTDIMDFTPVQHDEPGGEKIITQYEMHAAEDVGLIKFDILGIRNLSILGSARDIVRETRGINVDLQKVPFDDKKTYEMLGRGETMGVFQMGSSGMTKWLIELQPERIEDLMAMVALYRPGPMQTIPEYIERKRDPSKVSFLDPRMEKFLGASYGLIVYQDDLLFCALDLAGYTWEEADKFRKAVGKKIPEEMAAQKEKFTQGIITHGQTPEFAEVLWKLFEPFQSYGFNKAHAASYGIVSYQTAYMKANFPVEYMCALLTAESGDTEKITEAVNECRRMGIALLPPDINESEVGFTIVKNDESLDGQAIRFGLSAIKHVGGAAIEAILEARKKQKFTSFADFCTRPDARKVNKKVVESLIKVGALSAFGNRAALLSSMDEVRTKPRPKEDTRQQDLFGSFEEDNTNLQDTTIHQIVSEVPELTEDEIQVLERELLGFSLSARPLTDLINELLVYRTQKIKDIIDEETSFSEQIKISCVVSEVREVVTKKTGAHMAFVKVEDETGIIDLVIFPKIYAETKHLWVDYAPLLITGKLDRREDKPSLLVDIVDTVETVKTREGILRITIPENTEVQTLKSLKNLLEKNPGNQEVLLVFEGLEKKELKLPFRINWSESLSREISYILLAESTAFEVQ